MFRERIVPTQKNHTLSKIFPRNPTLLIGEWAASKVHLFSATANSEFVYVKNLKAALKFSSMRNSTQPEESQHRWKLTCKNRFEKLKLKEQKVAEKMIRDLKKKLAVAQKKIIAPAPLVTAPQVPIVPIVSPEKRDVTQFPFQNVSINLFFSGA